MNNSIKEPILRTIPMPSDTISENYVSAGWILSQMDLAGGKGSFNYTKGRSVTVSLNAMSFHQPVFVSDEVSIFGEYLKVGRSSLTLAIEAWAHRRLSDEKVKVTEAVFTFVHTDENRRPIEIKRREDIQISNRKIEIKRSENENLLPVLTKEQYFEQIGNGKELALRTVPLPRDTNYLGDIFGGWILAQMDLAGVIKARHFALSDTVVNAVTVGIEEMVFHNPVFVGDQVSFLTKVHKIGNTSVTIKVESYVFRNNKEIYEKVTEGLFTYVAIDKERNPVQVQK